MRMGGGRARSVFAVSDLHVNRLENRRILESLRPQTDGDWLLVCGDVSDDMSQVEWALELLTRRFARVVWVPGNHELWTYPYRPTEPRGEQRYMRLVDFCRKLGILTPEDPYPTWDGPGGPAVIAPLFLLYDYSFGRNIAATKERALALAERVGIVCNDEFLLHPEPYDSREEWCSARVTWSEARLAEIDAGLPTVLVNHYPLSVEPTRALFHPEFAQWCGTVRTVDWHLRFRAAAVVYGHLHIPRTTWHTGVRFEEVSLGYPREWARRGNPPSPLRRILPAQEA
jgi:3',5'-cyclic AMP phosphodiesterase CpdA